MTASTLVDGIDSEKEPAKAYKHDNMLLSIERSFFNDEKTEDSCTGAVKTVLLNWLTNRKTDGYFRI